MILQVTLLPTGAPADRAILRPFHGENSNTGTETDKRGNIRGLENIGGAASSGERKGSHWRLRVFSVRIPSRGGGALETDDLGRWGGNQSILDFLLVTR